MGPPRSKKRRPSFRRLVKTSGLKLENKLRNRQLRQDSAARKGRKEQRRMRRAVKAHVQQAPRPLETYSKTPEEQQKQEDEEEEFLEALPTDMMDDDDLLQMTQLAQQASFVTRDLSACGPVHSGKRRRSEVEQSYEKVPRKMARTEEKEVIHLLPIKDQRGVVPRSIERAVATTPEEEEEEDEEQQGEAEEEQGSCEGAPDSSMRLSAEEMQELRLEKLKEAKQRIASLASAIVSAPTSSMKRLKELRTLLTEAEPCVAVTVRKLVMVSLMEVFKDIVPTYRIRPPTAAEKAVKVKKETLQLREFEEGLLSQYKFYLEDLEQIIRDWRQQKEKRHQAVALQAYGGLAEVAARCLCELLLSLPHFNFHNNIIATLAALATPTRHAYSKVASMCCEAFRKLFQQDRVGGASLAAVRVISGLVKSLNYNVRPELLRTLLSLRIKEVDMKKDMEHTAPHRKVMTNKDKKKNLSRMQRKWRKAGEKLEKELLEAEACESNEKKVKLHTDTLNIVFLTYFRILKKTKRSELLPAVLEGLANFAHLINLEFFDDLLSVLQNLIQSGELTNQESLHCIQTVFTILSGQGDVLTVDPLLFYSELYVKLLELHAGGPDADVVTVLRCLDAMLLRRRKQVTLQRALAFLKRLSTLSLHLLPNAALGVLATTRATMHAFPRCDLLLDNDLQGGLFLPELPQPEHCNAQNTALWELHTLQRHFHPVVRQFAAHLSRGAASEGAAALGPQLSRRSPLELVSDYSVKDMTFNPPVSAPPRNKKGRMARDAGLLDAELQRQVDAVLNTSEEAELHFTLPGAQ